MDYSTETKDGGLVCFFTFFWSPFTFIKKRIVIAGPLYYKNQRNNIIPL